MNRSVAYPVAAALIAAGIPAQAQTTAPACNGVEALLKTSDITAGSSFEVEVTVRSDLTGKASGVLQFTGVQGPSSIISSANQIFSQENTLVQISTKPTARANNYKGDLLGVVDGVPCVERVTGILDLRAP